MGCTLGSENILLLFEIPLSLALTDDSIFTTMGLLFKLFL